MNTLESAKINDLEICMKILNDGKMFQREHGFIQWDDDYPTVNLIKGDIENQKGYVVKSDGKIAGYMCIDFDGEPAYKDIRDGSWNTDDSYAVVHRMALNKDFIGKGMSDITFKLIEKLCLEKDIHNIRVDTHSSNKRMQHVFKRNSFKQCGVIIYQGGDRLAFDKKLD